MNIEWLSKESDNFVFHAPYIIDFDNDYYKDLRTRYNLLLKCADKHGADTDTKALLKKTINKVLKAIREYYKGNIASMHQRIENIVKGCLDNNYAASDINNSKAFPGYGELQLFRARVSNDFANFGPKDMLHVPFTKRSITGNYRFSIPGLPCLYLANSSYGCWIEMGCPADREFNVSPILLDGSQRIFNLAIRQDELLQLDDEEQIKVGLILYILEIATSYRVRESNRQFKSEYLVSQSIMLACKKQKLDGVAYCSKQVDNECYSLAAVNLALFTNYEYRKEYSGICSHIKVDNASNYSFYKKINRSSQYKPISMRLERSDIINIIGTNSHYYKYTDTDFFEFDKFLFVNCEWNNIDWGNALDK